MSERSTPTIPSNQIPSPTLSPTPPSTVSTSSNTKGKGSASGSSKFAFKNLINVPRLTRKSEEDGTKRKKTTSRLRDFFRGSSPTRSEPGHQEDSSSIMSSMDGDDAHGFQRSDDEIMSDMKRGGYFQPRTQEDVTASILRETLGDGDELLDYGNITSRLMEHNRAREIVSGDLSKRVLDSYNDFVEGMQRIHEVGVNIQQSTAICASSRLSLKLARTTVTEAALEIASKYRRQQRYLSMLETLRSVKAATARLREVSTFLAEKDGLESAIEALLKAKSIVTKLSEDETNQLVCVEGLEANVAKATTLVNNSVDAGMREVCQSFDGERYKMLLRAYHSLGRGFEILNRIDECFTLDMDYRSKKVIMLFVDQSSNTFASFQSIEKVCVDKAAADVVPDRMIDCLLNVFGVYLEIMWNFHAIRRWHDENPISAQNASDSLSAVSLASTASSSSGVIDIRPGIDRIKRKLWLAMERYVVELLRCVSLSKFQVEDALTTVEATNLFVKAGMAFCASAEPDMIQSTLTDIVRAYFDSVKTSMTEDVLTLLENEQWFKVPISIRVSGMKELQGLQTLKSSLARCNPRALFDPSHERPDSPANNPFYGSARSMVLGPDSMPQQQQQPSSKSAEFKEKSEDDSGTDYNEIDDNAQELAGQFVDDADDVDADDHSPSSATSGAPTTPSAVTEEPTVTNSVITIVKKFARYLRMMQVLDSISLDIFRGIATIFNSYVWTVWSWFVINVPPESGTFKASRVLEGLKMTAEKADVLSNIMSDSTQNSSSASSGGSGLSSAAGGGGDDDKGHGERDARYQDSIAPVQPEGFVPPAAAMPSSELNDAGCLYGLGKRIVAVESLLFFKDAMKHIKPALLAFLGKDGNTSNTVEVEIFYKKNVERVDAIRVYMYRSIAPYLTSVEQTQTMIEKQKWDTFSNTETEKNYISLVKREATTLSTKVESLRRKEKIPQSAVVLVWESFILNVMDVLLEGYSRVRKCSNEGRAEMALDLQTLATALGDFTGLQPVPGLTIVDAYVKAFFVTGEDFLEMCRRSVYFTQKMLTNLFTCQSTQLSRKQKVEFQNSIDEISKGRIRKPLWQFVPADQLKLARENALAPKKKRNH